MTHTEDTKEMTVEKIIDDPRVKPFWDKIPYTKSKILEHPEGVTIINYLNDEISQLIVNASQVREERDREILDIINPKELENMLTTGNCVHGSLSGLCGKCAQYKLLKIEQALTQKT